MADPLALHAVREAFTTIVNVATAAELGADVRDSHRRLQVGDWLGENGRTLGKHVRAVIGDTTTATPPASFGEDLVSGLTTALAIAGSEGNRLPAASAELWLALLGWLASRGFGGGPEVEDRGRLCRERFHRWGLHRLLHRAFRDIGLGDSVARRRTAAVAAIHTLPMWRPGGVAEADAIFASWMANRDARRALNLPPRPSVAPAADDGFRWFVGWTTWVAAVRLVEYPAAYGLAEPPILDWVAGITADLFEGPRMV